MIHLSIIITGKDPHLLPECLEALRRQDVPHTAFEAIVAVDGAGKTIRQMLATVDLPYRLRVVARHEETPAVALNATLAEASGDYCLFLHADTAPEPGLLAEHMRVQRERGGVVAADRVTYIPTRAAGGMGVYGAGWWNDHSSRLEHGAEPLSYMDCHANNLSLPRQAVLDLGGFAEDLPFALAVWLGMPVGIRPLIRRLVRGT